MKQIITNFNNTPEPKSRLSWGGILAGILCIFALLVVAHFLGTALGIDAGWAHPSLFLVWQLVVNMVAVFAGGLVCTKAAALATRGEAILHGFLCWGAYIVVSTTFYLPLMETDLGNLWAQYGDRNNFALFLISIFSALGGILGGLAPLALNNLRANKNEKMRLLQNEGNSAS